MMRGRKNQDGAVAAETAVVLPVLVLVAAALAWLVAAGVNQVRTVDAARETARALARDEDPATAEVYGRKVAPEGAVFAIRHDGGHIEVEVVARIPGPARLFGGLPGFTARSTAVAQAEP
ncbi:hypothetical protein ABIE44_001545 [Marmoricola sp. OAE513]|uniref:TadE family type IV pilus minor pilin n=1 Tax=Marmoricola sp. OAE513 TaxID=2817894 RepID=UPI001AE65970